LEASLANNYISNAALIVIRFRSEIIIKNRKYYGKKEEIIPLCFLLKKRTIKAVIKRQKFEMENNFAAFLSSISLGS